MLWDIFCRVIDNHGDLGVCWRLCADLAARGHRARLWVDDPSALQWMAPGALQGQHPGIEVRPWAQTQNPAALATLERADVWIEGFGCEIAIEFIAAYAYPKRLEGQFDPRSPVWINLEYLSAERYVARCHGLPSPVLHGPAQDWTKHFFYPGFTPDTGGLLREVNLLERQRAFAVRPRTDWLASLGLGAVAAVPHERWIALFCYEPTVLAAWLTAWATDAIPTRLLVCAGRATAAVRAVMPTASGHLTVHELPHLNQLVFDELLWACDLNCVRGEDSLVRALWAGKPLLWHIYPQDDAAHHAKLNAFLDWLDAPPPLRAAHHVWNGLGGTLAGADLPAWATTFEQARDRLLAQDDLTSQLLRFVGNFVTKKQ